MAPLWLQSVLPDTPPLPLPSPGPPSAFSTLGAGVSLMADKCLKLNYSNSMAFSCLQWLVGPEIPSSGLGERWGLELQKANGEPPPPVTAAA